MMLVGESGTTIGKVQNPALIPKIQVRRNKQYGKDEYIESW